MPKKKPTNTSGESQHGISGFDIKIDAFGHMESNVSINKLNDFLNKNIKDKKLEQQSEEE